MTDYLSLHNYIQIKLIPVSPVRKMDVMKLYRLGFAQLVSPFLPAKIIFPYTSIFPQCPKRK